MASWAIGGPKIVQCKQLFTKIGVSDESKNTYIIHVKIKEVNEMHRSKTLSANGYSLEAQFSFNEETNELDMRVRMNVGMHAEFDYKDGKHVVIRTKYKPEDYEGTWENMPEFQKWVKGSAMIRVLYEFYRQHRQALTDIEHDTIVALLEA